MPKLSPKEVRERTEDVFEPVKVLYRGKSRRYDLEVLGFYVIVQFNEITIGLADAKTIRHCLSFIYDIRIWSNFSNNAGLLYDFFGGSAIYRVPGVPLKKILRKIIRFWRAELENLEKTKKREKAGDLTS